MRIQDPTSKLIGWHDGRVTWVTSRGDSSTAAEEKRSKAEENGIRKKEEEEGGLK